MNRFRWFAVLFAAVLLAVGTAGQAATWTWTGTDGDIWSAPNNWNTPVGDANIPGVDYIGDQVNFGILDDVIDLAGVSPDVGKVYISTKGVDIVNNGAAAALNCTDFQLHNAEGGNGTHVYVPVNASGRLFTTRKTYNVHFYEDCTFSAIEMGQSNPVFYKPVTITQAEGLEVFYSSINIGGGPNYTFKDTLTTGDVTIWSDASEAATLTADSNATLANVSGTVTINGGGVLQLNEAQNVLPAMEVNAFGLLRGDVTGVTYGAGNVNINDDAILALTAGPEPTTSDLGLVSGVKDAPAWKGVTADGTFEIGDDGDSVYKGVAIGAYTEGQWAGKTLRAPAGTGNLQVVITGGAPTRVGVNGLYMETADQTGVADINLLGSIDWKGGTVNQNPDGNSVTTFNMSTDRSASAGALLANLHNNFTVQTDQTYNFSGMGYVRIDETNMKGKLSFSNGSSMSLYGPLNSDPNIHVTFGDNGIWDMWEHDTTDIENLDFDTQITMSDSTVLNFTRNGVYSYDDANNPNLIKFIGNAHISMRGTTTLPDAGLPLGDGKFMRAYDSMTLQTSGTGIVQALGDSTGVIGFAAAPNETLTVAMTVDANGGTVQIGSDDGDMLFTSYEGKRIVSTPDGRVGFVSQVNNAEGIVVAKGRLELLNNAMDSGTLVGGVLEIHVEGDAAVRRPPGGASVLSKTKIVLDQGAWFHVQDPISVNEIVLNSTYALNNDGLQGDGGGDDITITGRLSGNGEWGDTGSVIIADGATIAPGNGDANQLTGVGDTGLILNDGAIYEWQVANADGTTPKEDYDVIDVDFLTIDGTWTLTVLDGILTAGTVEDTDEFTILVTDDAITTFDFANVTLDLPTGWSGGTIALGDSDRSLVLSGLISGNATNADTNGDGVVDATDYIALKQHLGLSGGATLAQGDTDGDGDVDWDDLTAMTGALNSAAAGATIPEPATMGLLALGALAVIRRRRK